MSTEARHLPLVSAPTFPMVSQVSAEPVEQKWSPDWVRISMASAFALQFRSGRFTRDFAFGGINLLLNYEMGCLSDCSYCGLARTRPGSYTDKSFIRVEWPLVETDELVDRIAKRAEKMTRLCISMVTHGHAYRDTADITERIRAKVATPLSILVAPPTLNRERLEHFKELGVDMIGVGLDAVTEHLFREHRTEVPAGGLDWDKYWAVTYDARDIWGPWKVNCHTLVGLGETDRDLCDIFCDLCDNEIFPYLFSFNPEPDSRLADHDRASLTRWRRIQLMKYLVETVGFRRENFAFDDDGNLARIIGPSAAVGDAVRRGIAFMTNGCPGPAGEPGCTRPYGSYRPADPFRDFPFLPDERDMEGIVNELKIDEILVG